MANLTPAEEMSRLAVLSTYELSGGEPEFALDALTELAAQISGCPVAFIGFLDDRRQWFKSKYGLPFDFVECPRDITVCQTTISSKEVLHVPDLLQDSRFSNLPNVAGEPRLRFYCGIPLVSREGQALGTLCVVDFVPRELTASQKEAIERLSKQAMAQLELRRQLKERETLLDEIRSATVVDAEEKAKADLLIRQVLPERVANEFSAKGHVEARYHESTTILFSKLSSSNRASEAHDPARLVGHLSQFFTRFDEIAEANQLETLKTIGETYISAGGLIYANRTHAMKACIAALQMQLFVRNTNRQREKLRLPPWVLRVGVNTGSLVAGVIGTRRLTYDVWGNAVNVAQRIQEACDPGRVNVSASTLHQLGSLFESQTRGAVQVKHLGPIDMYFLGRIRPQFSADDDGVVPNGEFWRWSGGHHSLA